jgi:SAM-dependent methyltransferase
LDADEYALMDAAEESMWWYRALHRRLLRRLDGVAGRVLDAGCGTGGFLRQLAVHRPELSVWGVDFSPAAAVRAADKSGAEVVCASVDRLPFADGVFDAVVSADVLCHRSLDPSRALSEFRRVLRPGGRLVLNLPAYGWLMSAHDVRVHTARRSTAGGLRRLLREHGFIRVRPVYWNSLLLPLMVVERKLLARGPGAASDVKPFPPWMDAAFFAATEVELGLGLPMPAGGSVMVTASAP